MNNLYIYNKQNSQTSSIFASGVLSFDFVHLIFNIITGCEFKSSLFRASHVTVTSILQSAWGGLVVSVSASHGVGRGFSPRSGHTEDHRQNGTNRLSAWHAGIR